MRVLKTKCYSLLKENYLPFIFQKQYISFPSQKKKKKRQHVIIMLFSFLTVTFYFLDSGFQVKHKEQFWTFQLHTHGKKETWLIQSFTLCTYNFPVVLFLNQNLNNLYNLYSPKLRFNDSVGSAREITAAAHPAVLFSNDNVIPH